MKKFMKQVDLFCYRHPKFGINNLMLYIVIANIAVWLISAMDTTRLVQYYLTGYMGQVLRGEVWRIVTFVLIPQGSGLTLLISLYLYYFIGSTLEREWGAGRFTIYYLMGMMLTVAYGLVSFLVTGIDLPVTANYINMSMFFAFATLFPDHEIYFMFILRVKMKWLALLDALYFAYSIFSMFGAGFGMMSFLPLIAILNYFLFCGDELFGAVMPRGKRQRQNTTSFKREVQKIRHETKNKDYSHKCAVCGKTEADHPELEFRYCSRCEGYHCFCIDHINNHVHFTE